MRIAFVTTEFAGTGQVNGGLGNYLVRITKLLAERGHQCEVFVCNGNDLPKRADKEYEKDGVRVRVLTHHAPDSLGLQDLPLSAWTRNVLMGSWRLAEAVRTRHAQMPFDLIQAANCGLPGLFIDVPVPLVMRLSSYEPVWYKAYGFRMNVDAAVLQILERTCMLDCESVYAPSAFLGSSLAKELKMSIDIIPSPAYQEIAPEQWDSAWAEKVAPQGQPYLVFVGSISRMKGCHVLGEAIRGVLAERPEVHFQFVGREISVDMDAFFNTARAFASRVHLLGSQPHARVYPLVARAVGLVAPSLVENLPNSVLEASLLGTPVVGTHGTSIEEVIENGVSGFLVPPGDSSALRSAILEILKLPAESRRALGERARSNVQQHFGPEACVSKLIAHYEAILGKTIAARIPSERRLAFVLSDVEAVSNASDGVAVQLDAVMRSRTWRVASKFHRVLDLILKYRPRHPGAD